MDNHRIPIWTLSGRFLLEPTDRRCSHEGYQRMANTSDLCLCKNFISSDAPSVFLPKRG
jgi:hypothetical protein